MHVGRTHERIIAPPNTQSGRALLLQSADDKKHFRSILTNAEVEAVLTFLNTRRNEFPSKLACFRASLEAIGADKRMIISSGAATRYFQKADALSKNGAAVPAVPAKRKYTRRPAQPVAHEVHVNFCPNCGCNIHAVATGMAMAKL